MGTSSEFSFAQDGHGRMALKFFVLAVAAVSVHAEADAEAAGPVHHAVHHPVHHAGVYGYSPAPPAYGPVEPVYHTTPVYTPEVAGYVTPVVHQAPVYHEVPVHHAVHPSPYEPYPQAPYHEPVHHAVHAVHAPAPYHEPAAHPHPKPDHYEPPKCSVGNPKTWCLEDAEYPAYEIEHALQYHYEGVQAIYKDVLANTENSVERLLDIVEETYLCPSVTAYIQPRRAVNTAGKWRIVVNGVKAHYETLSQTARIEECTTAGESCPLVPPCYETKCLQKNIYHRFLVYDAYDQYFPFAIETFKLPSACACYNGDYVEPPHRK